MSPVLERYESIPSAYRIAGPPPQSLRNPESAEPAPCVIVPLWELRVGDRLLKPVFPVGIRIRFEEGTYHAENNALAVYGSGASKEEAISDFKEMAGIFAAEYRELGPDEVIGLAVRVRDNFLKAFPL